MSDKLFMVCQDSSKISYGSFVRACLYDNLTSRVLPFCLHVKWGYPTSFARVGPPLGLFFSLFCTFKCPRSGWPNLKGYLVKGYLSYVAYVMFKNQERTWLHELQACKTLAKIIPSLSCLQWLYRDGKWRWKIVTTSSRPQFGNQVKENVEKQGEEIIKVC